MNLTKNLRETQRNVAAFADAKELPKPVRQELYELGDLLLEAVVDAEQVIARIRKVLNNLFTSEYSHENLAEKIVDVFMRTGDYRNVPPLSKSGKK